MTYLVFLNSEENNDKVESLSKLSSIKDFLLNKRLLLPAKEVRAVASMRRSEALASVRF